MALVRKPSFWWRLVIVWFVTLFLLSSVPTLPPGPKIPFADKIEHTIYYAIGAAWFYLARRLAGAGVSGRNTSIGAVLFCAAVGAFDEFHQSFVPNRSGNDPYDWLADVLGAFPGSLAGWLVWRMLAAPNRAVTTPGRAASPPAQGRQEK